MKADPVNSRGTRFTTRRLTHHSRHTECVLMIQHIKGDIEKKTMLNKLSNILESQQIDAALTSCNSVQHQVRTIYTPRLTTGTKLF